MDYIELEIEVTAEQEGREIITALLAEIGYESFTEDKNLLRAYIPAESFDKQAVEAINSSLPDIYRFTFTYSEIASRNWNAVWESDYPPVIIDGEVSIRAPFHKAPQNIKYDIVIEPKMSFGTAHHPTTAQMISMMLDIDFAGKKVLDMGCGTSVLAILAAMRGASHIDAVDNDSNAFENSIENVKRNSLDNIKVHLGDVSFLDDSKKDFFDIILANINRNILLSDLPDYLRSLKKGGLLLMSGFYEKDLALLNEKASEYDLQYLSHSAEKDWTAAKWIKK